MARINRHYLLNVLTMLCLVNLRGLAHQNTSGNAVSVFISAGWGGASEISSLLEHTLKLDDQTLPKQNPPAASSYFSQKG